MKKRPVIKIIILVAVAALVTGAVFFYKTWYMPHRDVMDAYTADENKANALYLDKAIEVSGEVSDVSKNEAGKTVLSLKTNDPMGGVRCTLKDDPSNIAKGSAVTIKGICTGYLMDVTLIDCYLVP